MPSRLKTFFHEHKLVALTVTASIIIMLIVATIIIVALSNADNDGIEGDDSSSFDASLSEDYKALSNNQSFGISKYLPIISISPSYKISYDLSSDKKGDYTFKLILDAYSASAREPMIKRLLSEKFGEFDPLEYKIKFLNYYNPFTGYSIEDLKFNNLPSNIEKSNYYTFDNSEYSVQTLTHTIYDGTTNTYRYVLKNGEPITIPKLLFTYQDLPNIDKSLVKSLNSLD